MNKLKVVHIVESFGGGIYSYLKDLSFFLHQKPNIENFIIYSDKRKEINNTKIIQDLDNKAKLIKIDMERNIAPFKDIKATLQIKKVLDSVKPDIIHLHSSKAGVIGRVAGYFSKKDARIYYTPHAYSFLRQDVSKVKRSLFKLIEKISQKIFGGITIACGDTEFLYAKSIGPSLLVRNGVDIDRIRSMKLNKDKENRLTIGTLARIAYGKNPQLFNQIAKKYPNIQFIWIGDGELSNEITSPNIKITGWIKTKEECIKWLSQLDIYIQTSLWEGLPISILEAMAINLPVIATNVIGNKDIVKNGENGYLFDDIEEFDQILNKLLDESKRKNMGNNAYNICSELFDMNKNFNHLLKIYFKS
ncbi:MAG: glycosyltransferase [Flavobacteriales bacterium]